ncbi:MAG: hypothetical protein KZQ74_03985, partial [gamma proteobacterium symbiont of Bathyaustriella thionipta]|nr:hypothetical protein [gamma proteobacterium symbiont of Bathyaustriella thionipta]
LLRKVYSCPYFIPCIIMTFRFTGLCCCSFDNHLNCYTSNDAVISFEPVKTQLLHQGAKQLFDSRKIPGRIVDVLVVHQEATKAHTHTLKNLLIGYFKARQYLRLQPQDAARLMAPRQHISASEVLASYEGLKLPDLEENRVLLNNNLQDTITDLSKYMIERQLLRKIPDVENIIDARFLPQSNKE